MCVDAVVDIVSNYRPVKLVSDFQALDMKGWQSEAANPPLVDSL